LRIRILFFASLKERAGTAEEVVDLPDGADVAAAWNEAISRHPALREVRTRPAAACDMTYASWDTSLEGVAELAFLPAVSGG
jgi:molybdopterin converting factor subunit 1